MTAAEIDEMRTLIHRAVRHTNFVKTTCYGKVSFDSPADASRAIRRPGLESYRCRHCGNWHVGTSRRGPEGKGREMRVL